MASILRTSKFVRYFAGFARNLVFNTVRETETNFVQQSQCLCGNFGSGYATAAASTSKGLDRSLKRLDDDVRRSGRISRRDLEEVLEEIRLNRSATSAQSLLVIRCCGNLVPEELPEVRTALVQEIWKTLNNLNVAMDISHYNALLRVFLDNEHSFSPTEFLADLQSKGLEPNRVTYQRLISRYCQQGDIEGATKILEFMREKQLPVNEYVFNALIMGHAQADDLESATGILAVMSQAGLQPSADTYTTLLCGYARKGDIDYICKMCETCEQKEIFLLDKDILEIIYALAANGHAAHADRLIEKIRRQAGYNQDAVNVILRLINKEQEDVALKLLRTMPRASKNDGDLANTGGFMIRQLIRARRPATKVISICRELQENGMHDKAFLLALESALKGGAIELALSLLRECNSQNLPIRQHYFWPLLCFNENPKQSNTENVLQVLRLMETDFEIHPSGETVREYAIPNMAVKNNEEIIQLLRSVGISTAVASSSCAFIALENNDLEEAASLAVRYRAFYSPRVFRKPLVQALVNTQNFDAYVRFARAIYDGLGRIRSAEEESEQTGEAEGNSGNIQADTLGSMIYDVLATLKTNRVEAVRSVLTGFVNQGLTISNHQAERIQDRMGSEMTSDISDMLAKLVAGDLEPIQVENSQQPRPKASAAAFSVPQLERMIKDFEARQDNTNGLKNQLIRTVVKSNDVAKTEEVVKMLEADNYVIPVGVYAQIIEQYAVHGKLEDAFNLLDKVKAKQPDFELDDTKIITLAQGLIDQKRFEEGLNFLTENKRTRDENKVDFTYNSACWRLLNSLAEKGLTDEVNRLFNHMLENGYIKPQNIFLGSLIKVHLSRDDLPTAMTVFAEICQKYRTTPWKNELTCRLIQAEDAANLQRLTDLSTEVHGEVNSLYDLVFAFVDCGRIRQARKILETPGLRTRYQRIQNACDRYQQEGKTSSLEGLMEATKDLNHIDRSEIYYKLLQSYINEQNAEKSVGLWTKMQEEDVTASDAFLIELADFLKANGYEVPFVVPEATKPLAKENKASRGNTKQAGTSTSPQVDREIKTHTPQIRELKAAIKTNNPDRILEAYEKLSADDKPNLTDQSSIIEALVNRDRLAEASKLVLNMLEQKLYPVPRIFRYYLNKIALSGEMKIFEKIDGMISDDLKRQISFDNRYCHANVIGGNAEQYLAKLEKAISEVQTKEQADVHAKHFPVGGASGILDRHPELHERYCVLAEKYTKWNIVSPINALWAHYFLTGDTVRAKDIWDRHLASSSRVMFQKVVQHARDNKDHALAKRLIEQLKDSHVNEKGMGIIYSCLLDTLTAKGQYETALVELQQALKSITLESFNRSALYRVKDGLVAAGKEFPYTIPARNVKDQESSSSSSSSSDSSSDEDIAKAKRVKSAH